MTRAENSRQEPAGNHPLALAFQNASAPASASVPAQMPPPPIFPWRHCPPNFREGPEVPPLSGAGAGPQRASWGAASGSARGGRSGRLWSRCGGSAGSGARAAAGGGDGGPAAWARAARSFRPAPAPGRGRVSGGPASGAWAPRAGAGPAGPGGPRSAKSESAGRLSAGKRGRLRLLLGPQISRHLPCPCQPSLGSLQRLKRRGRVLKTLKSQ